jgi:hypothetical protein
MTGKISFATLKAAGFQRLAAIVPQLKTHRHHAAAEAMATVAALASCRLAINDRAQDVGVTLVVDPAPRRDPLAADLLAMLTEAIEAPVRLGTQGPRCEIGQWLDGLGLVDLVGALLQSGAMRETVSELADTVSPIIETVYARTNTLRKAHFAAVIRRDLPSYTASEGGLTRTALWALAPSVTGLEARPDILKRRRQALEIYGSLASILTEPAIVAAIDRADELAPLLCARLDIEPAKLRRLSRARSLTETFEDYRDYAAAVRELTVHSVPLHEWPAPGEWRASPWTKTYTTALFRVDYVGDRDEPRDAVRALSADILLPLAATRAMTLGLSRLQPVSYLLGGHWPPANLDHHQKQEFLTALRHAIIGDRGIKSFHEAASRWHRRAASLAAMRHERALDKPGWPALCSTWKARDGIHELIPLTSAAALVAEGNALQHCVGGYYSQCRSGDTQIFSLRSGADHAATLELLLSGEPGEPLILRAGQFRTLWNRPAPAHLGDIVRAFLDDLKSGAHPTARAEIDAYRKKMHKDGDHAWHNGPLPIDHARSVWPLYRTLVPRGAPEDFETWCERSGLKAAYDQMLKTIAM